MATADNAHSHLHVIDEEESDFCSSTTSGALSALFHNDVFAPLGEAALQDTAHPDEHQPQLHGSRNTNPNTALTKGHPNKCSPDDIPPATDAKTMSATPPEPSPSSHHNSPQQTHTPVSDATQAQPQEYYDAALQHNTVMRNGDPVPSLRVSPAINVNDIITAESNTRSQPLPNTLLTSKLLTNTNPTIHAPPRGYRLEAKHPNTVIINGEPSVGLLACSQADMMYSMIANDLTSTHNRIHDFDDGNIAAHASNSLEAPTAICAVQHPPAPLTGLYPEVTSPSNTVMANSCEPVPSPRVPPPPIIVNHNITSESNIQPSLSTNSNQTIDYCDITYDSYATIPHSSPRCLLGEHRSDSGQTLSSYNSGSLNSAAFSATRSFTSMSADTVKAGNIRNGRYMRNEAGSSCCTSTLSLALTASSSQNCTLPSISPSSPYLHSDTQTTDSSKDDTDSHTEHSILYNYFDGADIEQPAEPQPHPISTSTQCVDSLVYSVDIDQNEHNEEQHDERQSLNPISQPYHYPMDAGTRINPPPEQFLRIRPKFWQFTRQHSSRHQKENHQRLACDLLRGRPMYKYIFASGSILLLFLTVSFTIFVLMKNKPEDATFGGVDQVGGTPTVNVPLPNESSPVNDVSSPNDDRDEDTLPQPGDIPRDVPTERLFPTRVPTLVQLSPSPTAVSTPTYHNQQYQEAAADARWEAIFQMLLREKITTSSLLSDPASPQYHALRWLAYSDPMKLSVPAIKQSKTAAISNDPHKKLEILSKEEQMQQTNELKELLNETREEKVIQRFILTTLFYSTEGWGWNVCGNGLEGRNVNMIEETTCLVVETHTQTNTNTPPSAVTIERTENDQETNQRKQRVENRWRTIVDECDWYGVQCDEQGMVTFLKLNENGLRGYLPAEITYLPNLQQLYLSSNSIRGTIPTSIGNLQKLRSLHISENLFEGTIPRQIGFCTQVRFLDLSDNNLEGTLPKELFWKSMELTILDASRNRRLGGTIPSSLSSLSTEIATTSSTKMLPAAALHRESRNPNKDTQKNAGVGGEDDEEFPMVVQPQEPPNNYNGYQQRNQYQSNPDKLLELHLSGCDFSGTIPSDIMGRKLTNLVKLDLSNNRLEGTIPSNLFVGVGGVRGAMEELAVLNLSINQLIGSIPDTLYQYTTKLRHLNVGNNFLMGSISSSLGRLTNLEIGVFYMNYFTGILPDTGLSSLTKLETLHFTYNNIHGTMPKEICELRTSSSLTILSSDCEKGLSNGDEIPALLSCQCCTTCLTGYKT